MATVGTMDNCCGCTEGVTVMRLSAWKHWPGWWAFDFDPETDTPAVKYRTMTVRWEVDAYETGYYCFSDMGPPPLPEPPYPVSFANAWQESVATYFQWSNGGFLVYAYSGPHAALYAPWGYPPLAVSYSSISDGSTLSGESTPWAENETQDCGFNVETQCCEVGEGGGYDLNYRNVLHPTPAQVNPAAIWCSHCNGPAPEDCTNPGLNVYAAMMNGVEGGGNWIAGGSYVDSDIDPTGLILTANYSNGRIVFTLSDPYTVSELIADADTLLAKADFGDTLYYGQTGDYQQLQFALGGDTLEAFLTETFICTEATESGSLVQEFSANAATANYQCGTIYPWWDYHAGRIVTSYGCLVWRSRFYNLVTPCEYSASITLDAGGGCTAGAEGCVKHGSIANPYDLEPPSTPALGVKRIDSDAACTC